MEASPSREQGRNRSHHAGFGRGPGGAVRRRGTPIPVLPPRVPTPVPSSDTRGSSSAHLEPEPPPPPPPSTQQRDIAHLATRYLEDNVKAWINPRIYAKLDHEAITSPDYVYKPRTSHSHHHHQQKYTQLPSNYHNKHHQSKNHRTSNENSTNNFHASDSSSPATASINNARNNTTISYLGSDETEEGDSGGKYEELHRSSTTTTTALLSSSNSNGHQHVCLTRETHQSAGTGQTSGSRSAIRNGCSNININSGASDSNSVVIKYQHNHHSAVTGLSNNVSPTEMNGSAEFSNDRHNHRHLKNHVVPSNGAVTDTSRISHQTTVVYNGKQSSTMLTTAYHSQQKLTAKNLVGDAAVTSNGGLNLVANNGASSALPLTKISSKGSTNSVPLQSCQSQKSYVPNGTVNSGSEQSGYGRHQSPALLLKQSPRTHHYSGNSSVVDFLYGGIDSLSTGTSSPTLLFASAIGSGAPGSNHYSESKYAYSVSGVPGTPAQSSAAAAFFARAAQKMNLTSSPHRRKRHSSGEEDTGTGFSAAMRRAPPPVPPALLRRIGVKEVTGVGKVKVMLRVYGGAASAAAVAGCCTATPDAPGPAGGSASFFSVDSRKKQVTLFDPAACGGTAAPEDRRVGVAAPKMFAFDAIFTQEDSQTEVCSGALTDVIHAVINGTDGCLFCFGHARLGKTYTMVGSPESASTLGVIPCAISWLFRGINEQKQKTGARFSVRVSAVEVLQQSGGTSQQLKDLLAGHANDCEQSPGVYLRDDPLFGTQLQNQSELRVPTAEKAAFYLDAAVSSRSGGRSDGSAGSTGDSHLLYTLHVYQYSVAGKGHGVAGGRSRLHLIDLGSCERGKANGGIPLSGLGNVLLAIFNGQKHLPYREHKVTQLLKECLSSLTCHAAMIAHVSPTAQHYTDTLATVQLASRIHRMRRRKIKFSGGSAGSGGSSGEEAAAVRLQQAQENGRSTGSSDVDPSSSEQSADTVIYIGPSDDAATDGEHPPVYIPSLNSGDNRCAMGKALRGSSAEHRLPSKSGGTHQSKSASSSPAKSTSTQSKLPNGSVVEDRSSPSHRSSSAKSTTNQLNSKTSSPSHNSSCKSSPVRTPSKTTTHKTAASLTDQQLSSSIQSQTSSKIPVPFSNTCGNAAGIVSGSDEQWIDGPRISKSKVAEARSLLKDSHKKKETWIDGPLQTAKLPTLGNGHASGSYGFMDSHKKSMIRKWVENQTVQIQRQGVKHSTPALSPRPPTTGAPQGHTYKELTVFKTCEDEETEVSGVDVKSSLEVEPQSSISKDETVSLGASKESEVTQDVKYNGAVEQVEDNQRSNEKSSSEMEVDRPGKQDMATAETELENVEEEDDVVGDILPPLQLFQPHIKEISTDDSVDSLDVRLRTIQEQREATGTAGEMDDENDEDEVEIIEVEEPFEPVPMQDSCLQVTEEDIALCMGEIENPLPEVDQESNEEHPLRILSQENLTVVSTFTDSMSVVTDLERMLPRQFGQSEGTFPNHRPYSLYELPDDYIGQTELRLFDDGTSENKQRTSDLISNQTKFEQLARLHEMYKTKLARANVTKALSSTLSPSLQYRPPSRCQSLSMSDMLYGSGNPDNNYTGTGVCTGGGSIYSEPAYNLHQSLHQNQAKICDNCKMSFGHTGNGSSWYQPLLTKSTREHIPVHHPLGSMLCDSVSHRFCRSGCNISSLRHPDGASNPNLKEEVERVPGNGASTSDHEEETSERRNKSRQTAREEVRTVTGKAHDEDEEEEDEPPPVLPPSLPPAPSSARLHRRLFGAKTGPRHASPRPPCPAIGPEGYDSGHDSSSPSPRPTKASQLVSCLPGVLSNRRPAAIVSAVQCGSSGYESIVRDSECSSFGSSQDSDAGEPHDPGGSKKVPVLQYCREDVERLERRWTEAQGQRIRELRAQQQELKQELAAAKTRLLIPSTRWSYELHVEASMDCRDPSFLEALDRETQILQKRVEACKSHILMVTCFDAVLKQQD